jgi:hypothetical protein
MTNKNSLWGMLAMVLTFGLILAGCDTGSGGNGNGGLTLTIKNNYKKPITKLELKASDCTIDGLPVISERTSGSETHRDYEYTTSIAAGASKAFSIKADSGKTQPAITVWVIADGIVGFFTNYAAGLYGESYNRHFTVTVFPDGAVEGDFED